MGKLKLDFVREKFELEGYKLLSLDYTNGKIKLDYSCPKGHKHSMRFDNFRAGKRCPTCMRVVKPSIEYIREKMLQEGYVLITDKYVNNRQKLDYICKNKHIHHVSWSEWYSANSRCPYCSKNAKIKIEDIRESMIKEGYTLLSKEYINAHTHLEYICPNDHTNKITWSNWNSKRKFGCPQCSTRISKQEKEIQEFLLENNIYFVSNDRTVLINNTTNRPLELDLWFPDRMKAIEFNGEYWHNRNETVKLDLIKQRLCDKLNIDLLIVWFKDYIENKEGMLFNILEFINK